MELQPLTVEDIAIIGGTLVGLVLISWKFNDYVDRQVETDPLGSYSAVLVVMGTSYTLLAAGVIVGILFGWLAALYLLVIIFFCFGVAGTPMILGDMRRGARRRADHQARRRARPLDYNTYIDNIEESIEE